MFNQCLHLRLKNKTKHPPETQRGRTPAFFPIYGDVWLFYFDLIFKSVNLDEDEDNDGSGNDGDGDDKGGGGSMDTSAFYMPGTKCSLSMLTN